MDSVLSAESENSTKILADRIEQIERTLNDDEVFCEKDIESIYAAASTYVRLIEEKFRVKLQQLKDELNFFQRENRSVSAKNKQQFDKQIESINNLFCNGKRDEAIEKFQRYEQSFQRRDQLIFDLPKITLNDFNVENFFSFDSSKGDRKVQVESPSTNRSKNFEFSLSSSENQKPPEEISLDLNRSVSDGVKTSIRFSRRLETTNNDDSIQKSGRSSSFSALTTICKTKTSQPKSDDLKLISIVPFHLQKDRSTLIAANSTHIVLLQNRNQQQASHSLTIIERLKNSMCEEIPFPGDVKHSIGFLNPEQIYFFTDSDFLVYSVKESKIIRKTSLEKNFENDSDSKYRSQCVTGKIYKGRAFYIHANPRDQWIFSITDHQTWSHQAEQNLSSIFPDVTRFISLSVTDRSVEFLVQLRSLRYAVQICSLTETNYLIVKENILLSYAECPSSICSFYLVNSKRNFLFVTDPQANVIHLVTPTKYIKSHRLKANTLCYVEDQQELILASDLHVSSINLQDQDEFFSRYV